MSVWPIQTTATTFLPLLLKSSKPNILNISTVMSSNTYQARPDSYLHAVAYNTSKAAANPYTIALKGKAIVNALTSGFTTAKLNGYATGPGAKTAEEAAALLSKWALEEEKSDLFIGPDGSRSVC